MKPVLQQPLRTVVQRWKRKIHVQMVRGTAAKANDLEPCTCLNCGTIFEGNFCPRCGQSRDTQRIQFRHIIRNIASGFFNVDQGFTRTLIDLLYRPGYLVRDFLQGKRKSYFKPAQVLFVLAAIYLMIVQLIDPKALQREKQYAQTRTEQLSEPDSLQQAQSLEEEHQTAEEIQEALQEVFPGIPLPIIKAVGNSSNKPSDSSYLQRVWNLLVSWVEGNKAFQVLATVPIFALSTRLVLSRRKRKPFYNLTELVVAQTYFGAQTLLLSILYVLCSGEAGTGSIYDLSAGLVFAVFCLNNYQLFQLTWKQSIWKTIQMFACSLLIIVLLASVAVLLIILGYFAVETLFPSWLS